MRMRCMQRMIHCCIGLQGNPRDADTYEQRRADIQGSARGSRSSRFAAEKYLYMDTVRAAIKHMPADLVHVGYAASSGFNGDKLHFSAAAQILLGTRYARAMQEAAGEK